MHSAEGETACALAFLDAPVRQIVWSFITAPGRALLSRRGPGAQQPEVRREFKIPPFPLQTDVKSAEGHFPNLILEKHVAQTSRPPPELIAKARWVEKCGEDRGCRLPPSAQLTPRGTHRVCTLESTTTPGGSQRSLSFKQSSRSGVLLYNGIKPN